MAEYMLQANQILRAAGIPADSASASELLNLLADRARDWAERAAGLGGVMDAAAASRVAARTLCNDVAVQQRLELLEAGADELLAMIQSVVAGQEEAQVNTWPQNRLRRWGQEAQPNGEVRGGGGEVDQELGLRLPLSTLMGLPVCTASGEVLGIIEDVRLQPDGADLSCLVATRPSGPSA